MLLLRMRSKVSEVRFLLFVLESRIWAFYSSKDTPGASKRDSEVWI
jgi:hypothetical protein